MVLVEARLCVEKILSNRSCDAIAHSMFSNDVCQAWWSVLT